MINWVFPILNLKLDELNKNSGIQTQTHWFSVSSHNHYTERANCEWETQKSFQSRLTDCSWIHLILLIKLIQYEMGNLYILFTQNLFFFFKSTLSEFLFAIFAFLHACEQLVLCHQLR